MLRACLISSEETGSAFPCGESLPLGVGWGLGGKKCWRRASFMAVGVSAPGRVGNRGVFRGATYCLAVQMFWGVVLARKSAQYEALARFIALK